MALLQTRPDKLGNVVKGELWLDKGYTREDATILVTASTEIGTVFHTDGDGTYSTVAAAAVATLTSDVVVCIDADVYDTAAGDATLAVLKRGPAVIVREKLKFADALTEGQIDDVVAILEANGIQVATQV